MATGNRTVLQQLPVAGEIDGNGDGSAGGGGALLESPVAVLAVAVGGLVVLAVRSVHMPHPPTSPSLPTLVLSLAFPSPPRNPARPPSWPDSPY